MTTFGYFLSCEEHGPKELVRQAKAAERAGFEALWISDHFHPWLDEQGQSPFVWSVIGAIAQATATTAALTGGRFRLGVGTGEALNEHVVDSRWPPLAERLEMLEEAVGLMREMFTGKLVTHRGRHYRVDTARLYTLPEEPAPILMSGFGEKSIELAGRIADGYISTGPSAESVQRFHQAGGAGKPALGGLKACYAADEASARKTVHRLWPTQGIKGEASQLLPLPRHFEQLAQMVTEDEAVNGSPVGPDPEVHVQAIRQYVEAGFDEVYVNQIGEEQDAFFDFYGREVLPRLR